MYVHLGGGCLIRATDIIGIFPVKNDIDLYINLKNKKGRCYETEDLSENGIIDSVVLTENKLYLSAISSSTLQKRVNQNLIYINGGNNG